MAGERKLAHVVPGAADKPATQSLEQALGLPRRPAPAPEPAPGWDELRAYAPERLGEGFKQGVYNVLRSPLDLADTGIELFRGAADRVRDLSPPELRGTAPRLRPEETATYDRAMAALKAAKNDPVKAAQQVVDSLQGYFQEAVSSPQNTTQFIAENVNPFRPRGRAPVLEATRPSGVGTLLPDQAYMVEPDGKFYNEPPLLKLREEVDKQLSPDKGMFNPNRGRGLSPEMYTALREFMSTKYENYISRQLGTPDDPIYKAIIERRLVTPKLSRLFPDYVLDQRKAGKTRVDPVTGEERFYPKYPTLERDLEDTYDRMARVETYAMDPQAPESHTRSVAISLLSEEGAAREAELRQALTDRMRQQGSVSRSNLQYEVLARIQPEGQYLPRTTGYTGGRSASMYAAYGLPEGSRMRLPQAARVAMEKQEPFYHPVLSGAVEEALDPKNMLDYLSTLDPKKVKNLRFEDAVINTAKMVVAKDRVKYTISQLNQGKTVPRDFFDVGIKPVVSYADDSPLKGYNWVRIMDPEATQYEGAYMGHSVGGFSRDGGYSGEKKRGFKEGWVRIYSLRDPNGFPVTTVEMVDERLSNDPSKVKTVITQISGDGRKTGNVMPEGIIGDAVVDLAETFPNLRAIHGLPRESSPRLKEYVNELSRRSRENQNAPLAAQQPQLPVLDQPLPILALPDDDPLVQRARQARQARILRAQQERQARQAGQAPEQAPEQAPAAPEQAPEQAPAAPEQAPEQARNAMEMLRNFFLGYAEGGEVRKEDSPMASPVGGAKQMLAELESEDKKIAERKRPRSKESIEEERASKELDRGTLMSGSLVAPTIAREGELTVRRFAGGGSADKGKLTLEPVGGVEFGPANPAPRSLKDYVPGAADLPRSPPQKAPGWGDPAAYNPQGLSYGLGTGLTNALEGLSSLPGTAMDLMRGFGQRVRELSPEHLRGSAPAADTTVYDAAQAALKRAAGNPVEAAKQVAGAAMDYVRQGVSSPQNMAQFIGENINPLPKVGPRAGPTMGIVKEKGGNWVSVDPKALEKYRQLIKDHMADAERADLDEGDLEQERIVAEEDAGLLTDLYAAASTSPDLAISSLAARHSPDISNWLISKLGRYVKSEMGTKEDPLRALAEQGISHLGPEELSNLAAEALDDWGQLLDIPEQFGLRDTPPRTVLGPDIPDEVRLQMHQPPFEGNPAQIAEVYNRHRMARNWETLSDYAIRGDTYQNQVTSSVRRPYRGKQSDGSNDYINPETGVSWEITPGEGRPADYFNEPRPYKRWAEEDNIDPNDWIQQQLRTIGGEFAVKNPGSKAYSIRSQDVFRGLGFGHLADELEAALNNPEFPPQLRLTPKDLNALSVPDAVRRVHAINVWRENNKREPSLELANNPATVTVQQYPVPGDNSGLGEGYRWDSLELNKSMPRREAQKYLQEALDYEGNVMAGCQGTFCDSIMNRGTQLFSLRDAVTGGPKVTIELKGGFALGQKGLGQIKGFANKVPKEKYRPMILQFLNSRAKDISPSHAWSQGNDLASMGIVDTMEYSNRMRYASATPFQLAFSNILSALKADDVPELLEDRVLEVTQDLARRASGSRRGGGGSGRLLINAPLPRFMTAEQLKQAALETLDAYKASQLPKPPKPPRRPR